MKELLVSGLNQRQLRSGLASGKIIKIRRGLYTWRKPTPFELARIVHEKWPGIMLAGKSAVELYSKKELTFPLHCAYEHPLANSTWLKVQRTRQTTTFSQDGVPVQNPLLAAGEVGEAEALAMLEARYQTRRGKQALEKEWGAISRVPARVKELVKKAAIGADSEVERKVARALQKRGKKVQVNHQIGPYLWDIVVGKVAVEIDGYDYHKAEDLGTFIKDRWKGNNAALKGYTVLRYSGSCVKHHLVDVVQQIIEADEDRTNFTSHVHKPVWQWHWILAGFESEPIYG